VRKSSRVKTEPVFDESIPDLVVAANIEPLSEFRPPETEEEQAEPHVKFLFSRPRPRTRRTSRKSHAERLADLWAIVVTGYAFKIAAADLFPSARGRARSNSEESLSSLPEEYEEWENYEHLLDEPNQSQSRNGLPKPQLASLARTEILLGSRCPPDPCSICLDVFAVGQCVIKLPCPGSHAFHDACIERWFDHDSRCPNCRFNLLTAI